MDQYTASIPHKYLRVKKILNLYCCKLQYQTILIYLTRLHLLCMKKYYRQTFSSFRKFQFSVDHNMYFIAWLHHKGRFYNTMNTYLAEISYHHRIKGAQHLSSTPDIRLPVTPNILFQLVKALKVTVCGKFSKRFLAVMFTPTFLQVG